MTHIKHPLFIIGLGGIQHMIPDPAAVYPGLIIAEPANKKPGGRDRAGNAEAAS
jgi:hypothetical protein